MQFASRTQPGGASGSYVEELAGMLQHEPIVLHAVRLVQNYCISGGLRLRFPNNVPPTPTFARHIKHYYSQFCRDAIEAFLTVGFAPYWLRVIENGARVPEILPLGTYSWHVARNQDLMPRSKAWQKGDSDLLHYDVTSMYCRTPVHVYAFARPSPLFMCVSRLSSVLNCYNTLVQKRVCSMRADDYNSMPSLVFEQSDKTKINDVVNTGGAVMTTGNTSEQRDRREGESEGVGQRASLQYKVLDEFRKQSKLPEDSVNIMAPSNHSVRSLDRVLSPQEMIREELCFARMVGAAIGLPIGLLLQGSSAVASSGGSSAASGDSGAWSDCAESNNRLILDTCREINRHLELLLCDVYASIYGGASRGHTAPMFQLVCVPTINMEQLMTGFNNRIVDDSTFSAILESTLGAPLGEHAVASREELRKAEYVLPFRDRKEPPGSKKAKK